MLNVVKSEHATIFSLEEDTSRPTSIVVEVPTMNQPIYYGSGDIRDESVRVNRVVATAKAVYICKENGDEIVAPVSISGQGRAKIYQFGDCLHSYDWKKSKTEKIDIKRAF